MPSDSTQFMEFLGAIADVGQKDTATYIAQGQTATWIRNGEALDTTPVPADGRLSHHVSARPGDWFSLILRDASGPTLYSGAVYTTR